MNNQQGNKENTPKNPAKAETGAVKKDASRDKLAEALRKNLLRRKQSVRSASNPKS